MDAAVFEQLLGLGVVFAVGWIGVFVFRRLKFPNPGLLGAMFFTGALNVAGYFPAFPGRIVAFFSNMMVGIMLGRQINRQVIRRVRSIARFIILQVAAMLALSLLSGFLFGKMTGLPLATALLAGTAGGTSEMTAFAISIDANAVIVAFLQICRMVVFLGLFPYFTAVAKKIVSRKGGAEERSGKEKDQPKTFFLLRDYLLMVPCAVFGAWIAYRFRIPTGAMLGAMLVCGAYVLLFNRTYRYDMRIRLVAQIGLGSIMGQRVGPDIVALLGQLFFPALVATLVMVAGCLVLACVLHKMSGWDVLTCLLCSAPAGLSQITIYAEEIGADSFTISVFHTVRILGIVAIYPGIIMNMLP